MAAKKTEHIEAPVPVLAEPSVIEGPGRYKVFQTPDGGWIIARATGLCEKCENCGCGEQADPVQVPAMALALAQKLADSGKNPLTMLKAMVGRG